ncbi:MULTISPECIES: dTDP-glucose 4,6-dehydratase [unclassified Paenibacillus]|uniref:dTDP-glucose 4,6-dehydratase n=1 Tax=unclassified Paenibacillus TaxID=185978 RepID=UPI00278A3492|nr:MULTISPECIES: dTDP-glucose 4,6-dehydratase [unclassified Paenibacillus]MDQ0901573.1 dTDP-glucose 4,6-dehydratase [Paenibacillus sp. V4I7]MDQ0919926.1 dTDP-glucose 4,6-dehydratase [Paenibacillus sp. V4I5]
MRLLITGGMGFIGSNFILYMMNKYPEYQVYNLDLLTYAAHKDNVSEVEHLPNYHFIQGDICNESLLSVIFGEGIDAVVHFAAESHVDRSIEDPLRFVRTNIQGTHTLLEAAIQHDVKRFVQISTDEVYGSLGQMGYFTETTSLAPNSPYSASKAGADMLVRAYYHTYNFPAMITRCSNNYGPNQFPEKLIPLSILKVLNDQRVPLYGDGLNVRDWLYVEDHCNAIDLVLHGGTPGEVYNVGGNNEYTNIDIIRRILDELGKTENLIHYVKDRLGHDRRYAIDAAKIRNELGWKPSTPFEQGIKKTIQWYVNHEQWLREIAEGSHRGYGLDPIRGDHC